MSFYDKGLLLCYYLVTPTIRLTVFMSEWEAKNYSQRTVNFTVDMGGRICRDFRLFAQPVNNRITAMKNGLQHGVFCYAG
jgi:hypothetical protein